jgi:hypothetical protein
MKTDFYRNPIMREIWQGAFRDLCQADRISLLGYSLPGADLVFNGLLQEAFQSAGSGSNEGGFALDVVNTCPEPVLERLGLMDDAYAEQAQVTKSIKEFVRDFAVRSSEDCVQAMRYMDYERSQENRIYVPWGPQAANAVPAPPLRPISRSEGVRESDGALVLTIETPGQTVIDGIKLSDIREDLAKAKSIILRPDNAHGQEISIIGAWNHPADEHHIPQIVLAPGGPIDE